MAEVEQEYKAYRPLLTDETVARIHQSLGGEITQIFEEPQLRLGHTRSWQLVTDRFILQLWSSRARIHKDVIMQPARESVRYLKQYISDHSTSPLTAIRDHFDLEGISGIVFDEKDPNTITFVQKTADKQVEIVVSPAKFEMHCVDINVQPSREGDPTRRVEFNAYLTGFPL